MDRLLRAALAASMILGGTAQLATAARADDTQALETPEAAATVKMGELDRELAERARQDAEAIAADAMVAATDLDLDIRPAGPISLVLASDL